MDKSEADIKADKVAAHDRGERPDRMEHLLISERCKHRSELTAASTALRTCLPKRIVSRESLTSSCKRFCIAGTGEGDVADLLGATDRTARRITSPLLERGVLTSASTRAPLKLVFRRRLRVGGCRAFPRQVNGQKKENPRGRVL